MEIVRLARGISHEQLLREPSTYTVINTNSPLKLDSPMAMGIIEMARLNQICVVTPFTLAGAMAPVTLAGALVQQNAEALAGLALSQLTNPGAPFVYGGFTSNVDMKSGAPAFGTPEYMKACIIGGQLARRYKLPYRTTSTNAANSVDAQAAYETVFSLWGAIMGGGNIIQHAAGWMEGGLVASYEKFALDVDLLQMVQEFLKPLEVDDDTMGFRRHAGGGAGRPFLRRATHAGALFHRLLRSRSFPTGAISRHGRRRDRPRPRRRPMPCGSRRWRNTSHPIWSLPALRKLMHLLQGARKRAANPRIFRGYKWNIGNSADQALPFRF